MDILDFCKQKLWPLPFSQLPNKQARPGQPLMTHYDAIPDPVMMTHYDAILDPGVMMTQCFRNCFPNLNKNSKNTKTTRHTNCKRPPYGRGLIKPILVSHDSIGSLKLRGRLY